jgi:hypothetical protein
VPEGALYIAQLSIRNFSATSNIQNWAMRLRIPQDDGSMREIAGVPYVRKKNFKLDNGIDVRPSDWLVNKGKADITKNNVVTGYFAAVLPGIHLRDLIKPNTVIELEFSDIAGKKYTNRRAGTGPMPGETIPPSISGNPQEGPPNDPQ